MKHVLHIAAFICALLVMALATHLALAADWKTAPGPLREECVSSTREPEPRAGPGGFHYYIAPPTCRRVPTGKSPLFHLDGRSLIPSQQNVPEGSRCLRTITIDHHVYGQTAEGGSLWALCQP